MRRIAWMIAAFFSAIATPSFAESTTPKAPAAKSSAAQATPAPVAAATTMSEASLEYLIAMTEKLTANDRQSQLDVLGTQLSELRRERAAAAAQRNAVQAQRNQSTDRDANHALDARITTLDAAIATLDAEIDHVLDKMLALSANDLDPDGKREAALAQAQLNLRDALQSTNSKIIVDASGHALEPAKRAVWTGRLTSQLTKATTSHDNLVIARTAPKKSKPN